MHVRVDERRGDQGAVQVDAWSAAGASASSSPTQAIAPPSHEQRGRARVGRGADAAAAVERRGRADRHASRRVVRSSRRLEQRRGRAGSVRSRSSASSAWPGT